jgi:hypothetical protein
MAEYVLFCFRGAELVECERFHAPDDQSAADGALTRFEGEVGAELWQGNRRVEIFQSPQPAV